MPSPQLAKNKVLEVVEKRVVSGSLAVSPSSVEFKNFEPGVEFTQTFIVQNLAIEPKKITATLSSHYQVFFLENFSTSEAFTAPYGLDKKVILRFRPKEERDYPPTKIIFKSEKDQIEVPITAYPLH